MWLEIILFVFVAYLLVAYFFLQRGPARFTNFAGKHIFITGGSGGLGLAFATQVAELGAKVTILARNKDKLNLAHTQIEKKCRGTSKVMSISADVMNYKDMESAVQQALSQNGPIDLVVVNAGQSNPGYFMDIPVEDMNREIQLNYMGSVHTVKAVLPEMAKRRKGHIVFVSSAAAFAPFIGYTNYAASKIAVKGLSDGLRNELKLYDIDVSIFFPTGIDTEGFAEEQKKKPEETKKIEGASSLLSADTCAKSLVDGLRRGRYMISTEFFPTELLRAMSHGLTVRDNYFLDILLAPVLVLVSPLFVYDFDKVVNQSKKKTKKD